jgi:hypothetical protein
MSGQTQIRIGGIINKTLLPEFINLIDEERLFRDDKGNVLDKNKVNILDYVYDYELVFTSDNDSEFYTFSELEDWMMKHDIPFIRESDAFKEDDGMNVSEYLVFWLHGMPEKRYLVKDINHQFIIHVKDLEIIITAIKSVGSIEDAPRYLNHGNIEEKRYARYIIQEGTIDPISYLQSYLKLYYHEPELPKFQIL